MFDPYNPIDFKYLIMILTCKGSFQIVEFVDDILETIGVVINRDIGFDSLHYMIFALMSTKLCQLFTLSKYSSKTKREQSLTLNCTSHIGDAPIALPLITTLQTIS